MNFPSTILPQTNDPQEIQKAILDLLDKINQVSASIPQTTGLMSSTEITTEVAYTPTFTGFGTPTAVNFTWCRVGNRLKVMGKFTSGTPTATEARISLPNSLISDSALVTSITVCGIWGQGSSGITGGYYCLIESGVGYITISAQAAATAILTKQNGNAIIGVGNIATCFFELPISGWNT